MFFSVWINSGFEKHLVWKFARVNIYLFEWLRQEFNITMRQENDQIISIRMWFLDAYVIRNHIRIPVYSKRRSYRNIVSLFHSFSEFLPSKLSQELPQDGRWAFQMVMKEETGSWERKGLPLLKRDQELKREVKICQKGNKLIKMKVKIVFCKKVIAMKSYENISLKYGKIHYNKHDLRDFWLKCLYGPYRIVTVSISFL